MLAQRGRARMEGGWGEGDMKLNLLVMPCPYPGGCQLEPQASRGKTRENTF